MSKKYRGKEIRPCNSEITNSIKTESSQFDKPKIRHPSRSNLNAKKYKPHEHIFLLRKIRLFVCLHFASLILSSPQQLKIHRRETCFHNVFSPICKPWRSVQFGFQLLICVCLKFEELSSKKLNFKKSITKLVRTKLLSSA